MGCFCLIKEGEVLHPFKPEDFTEDDDFVREVIKAGVELKI